MNFLKSLATPTYFNLDQAKMAQEKQQEHEAKGPSPESAEALAREVREQVDAAVHSQDRHPIISAKTFSGQQTQSKIGDNVSVTTTNGDVPLQTNRSEAHHSVSVQVQTPVDQEHPEKGTAVTTYTWEQSHKASTVAKILDPGGFRDLAANLGWHPEPNVETYSIGTYVLTPEKKATDFHSKTITVPSNGEGEFAIFESKGEFASKSYSKSEDKYKITLSPDATRKYGPELGVTAFDQEFNIAAGLKPQDG